MEPFATLVVQSVEPPGVMPKSPVCAALQASGPGLGEAVVGAATGLAAGVVGAGVGYGGCTGAEVWLGVGVDAGVDGAGEGAGAVGREVADGLGVGGGGLAADVGAGVGGGAVGTPCLAQGMKALGSLLILSALQATMFALASLPRGRLNALTLEYRVLPYPLPQSVA